MSDQAIPLQEAKAIKKKITLTVLFIVVLALAAGGALFKFTAPAHAFADKPPADDYSKVNSTVNLTLVAKKEAKSMAGESIDFGSQLISIRSREAQTGLGNDYRPLRNEFATVNLDINRAYDNASVKKTRIRTVVASVDESLIKKGEEEKKLEKVDPKSSGGSGNMGGSIGGRGAAKIAAIARKVPQEFQELYGEITENVRRAETLWQNWVDGDRSTESNTLLDEAKKLLIDAREKYRIVRAANQDIDALDYVVTYVSTMIYDINKSNTGSGW